MKTTNLAKLISLAVLAPSVAFAQSFDTRSFAMGGVGVSNADYLVSAFHNPALGANYDESDDVGLLIPSIGVSVADKDRLIEQLDDFSGTYKKLENNRNIANANTVINSLKKMQGDQAHATAGAGLAVAIPTKYLSVNLFSRAYADLLVIADIENTDLDATTIINQQGLKSKGITMGVSVVETGVALASSFDIDYGKLLVGFTPKYQSVQAVNYIVDINNYKFDDWDNEKYESKESKFNVDLGVAFDTEKGYTIGLAAKNLLSNTYRTKTINNVTGEYKINPVYTLGASYNHKFFTLAADIDLNETEKFTSVTGTSNPLKEDNTQFAGIGAEFNAWDWAQLRVGYKHDIAGTLEDEVTAGIGISPFDVVHIDLAASYAGENQFGGAIQTYFTF